MPNVRQVGKRQMSFWLPMELYARFANAAKAKGLHMSEYLVQLMQTASAGTPVTPEQTAEMLRRVKSATVTPADVAEAVVENIAAIAENQAAHALRPTLRGIEINALPELTPIPKLGSRKKKRR